MLMSPVLDLCSQAAVPSVWLPQVGTTPTQGSCQRQCCCRVKLSEASHASPKQQPAVVCRLDGMLAPHRLERDVSRIRDASRIRDFSRLRLYHSVNIACHTSVHNRLSQAARPALPWCMHVLCSLWIVSTCAPQPLGSCRRSPRLQRACALCAGQQRVWPSWLLCCAGALQPLPCCRAMDGAAVPLRAAARPAVHGEGVLPLGRAVAGAGRCRHPAAGAGPPGHLPDTRDALACVCSAAMVIAVRRVQHPVGSRSPPPWFRACNMALVLTLLTLSLAELTECLLRAACTGRQNFQNLGYLS